jgi:hypothetical protein
MHDGEVATLPDAIWHHYAMGDAQADLRLKQTVSDAEVGDLVAFLNALTDEGFVRNPAFALPPRGCPVPEDMALAGDEAVSQRLHNSP